jgi:hypothetical protein
MKKKSKKNIILIIIASILMVLLMGLDPDTIKELIKLWQELTIS